MRQTLPDNYRSLYSQTRSQSVVSVAMERGRRWKLALEWLKQSNPQIWKVGVIYLQGEWHCRALSKIYNGLGPAFCCRGTLACHLNTERLFSIGKVVWKDIFNVIWFLIFYILLYFNMFAPNQTTEGETDLKKEFPWAHDLALRKINTCANIKGFFIFCSTSIESPNHWNFKLDIIS